jgi:2-oxoglutarate/2-oxoacid ferredoxin oxidoreductase subunit beta
MSRSLSHCVIKLHEEHHDLEDYQGGVPRWCNGCGDNAILAAMQRLCSDEALAPENTVFVSGIGCSSRLPHYMKTYGFHGLHGRAFPVAEGIKIARPDLNVFVSTGDGDCCSIGAGHWIHALRYNINLTVVLHDNHVYGLTKKQASPTSPRGLKSNTTPYGALLEPMNPLTVSLGVQGASFVAQAVDWVPEVLYDIMRAAFRHRGFSFVRVLQRCPEFMPKAFDPWLHDPQRTMLLTHADGLQLIFGRAHTATSASTIRSTSTRRARSRRSRIRSRSESCIGTRMPRATRTCATPASCARPNTSAPA